MKKIYLVESTESTTSQNVRRSRSSCEISEYLRIVDLLFSSEFDELELSSWSVIFVSILWFSSSISKPVK